MNLTLQERLITIFLKNKISFLFHLKTREMMNQLTETNKGQQYFKLKINLYGKNKSQKQLIVSNQTTIEQIKSQFQSQFTDKNNASPQLSNVIAQFNDIELENKFTMRQFRKCLKIDNLTKEQLTNLQLCINIHSSQKLPQTIKRKIYVLWTDPNTEESKFTYYHISKVLGIENTVKMIYLNTNEFLNNWLNFNKIEVRFLYEMRRIFFISNMNRPPHYQHEGIQTLKIARQQQRQHQPFVFYVSDKNKCKAIIQQHLSPEDMHNIQIANQIQQLGQILKHVFLNPLMLNQSGVLIQDKSIAGSQQSQNCQ